MTSRTEESKRKQERAQEKERIGKQAKTRTRQTERKPGTGKFREVQAQGRMKEIGKGKKGMKDKEEKEKRINHK